MKVIATTSNFSDPNHSVLYAFTPKIASTTWMRTMVLTSDHFHDNITVNQIPVHEKYLKKFGIRYMPSLNNTEGARRLKTYYKFMFARNPFERLLSAYVSKLLPDNGNEFYHRLFGRDIIKVRYINISKTKENWQQC